MTGRAHKFFKQLSVEHGCLSLPSYLQGSGEEREGGRTEERDNHMERQKGISQSERLIGSIWPSGRGRVRKACRGYVEKPSITCHYSSSRRVEMALPFWREFLPKNSHERLVTAAGVSISGRRCSGWAQATPQQDLSTLPCDSLEEGEGLSPHMAGCSPQASCRLPGTWGWLLGFGTGMPQASPEAAMETH